MTKKRQPNLAIDAFIDMAINYIGDDCLIWPFGTNQKGYAILSRLIKTYKTSIVSRAICQIAHGAPPTSEHQAAHSIKCISKACINRKHLRWATQAENLADDNRGEDCSWGKLTDDQVLEIRKLAEKMFPNRIAKRYNVTRQTINRIIARHSWQWLEEPSDAELLFETTRPRMRDLFA